MHALQARVRGQKHEAMLALAASSCIKDNHDSRLGTTASLFPPAGFELRQMVEEAIRSDMVVPPELRTGTVNDMLVQAVLDACMTLEQASRVLDPQVECVPDARVDACGALWWFAS